MSTEITADLVVAANNIFEKAALLKLRFRSSKGLITTEDLWEVPLRSNDQYNLEAIAQAASNELKGATKETFVPSKNKKVNQQVNVWALQLDIIKHVIAVKDARDERRLRAASIRTERNKLLDAMAEKNDAELKSLSKEELRKRLDALDVEADAEIG